MQNVVSLVLGGGRGKKLYPLTKRRSEPAVPIGGKYRLIDIPVSNCLNSGIKHVYILTQFLSVSLHRHIAGAYKFDPFNQGFVEVLPAQQTNEAADWYLGTADAVRQNLRYIQEDGASDVLILSGDQLYRMDFRPLIEYHRSQNADITLAAVPVTRERSTNLGILKLDENSRVAGFVEKPQTAEQLQGFHLSPGWLEKNGLESRGRDLVASMGIYLFKRKVLFDLLGAEPKATDFATQIFPPHLGTHQVQAYLFDGYWEDLGTIASYYQASMALVSDNPPFDFHNTDGVIYTRMRNLPASRVTDAYLDQCLVSDGCVVLPGARVERSLLGVRCRIGHNVVLRDSLILGATRYETDKDRAGNQVTGLPDFNIGDGSVVEGAIVDKDCRIGRNVQIINREKRQNADGENYIIRDGIVVIPSQAIVPDGTVI